MAIQRSAALTDAVTGVTDGKAVERRFVARFAGFAEGSVDCGVRGH